MEIGGVDPPAEETVAAPEAASGGGGDVAPVGDPKPSWFTPLRLLVIFCIINLFNYLDRGAIASNGVNGHVEICKENETCTSGSGIQGDFKLNFFQDGVLSSAFMVGLLVASPIFASLAKSHNPFRLIGVGLSVWTVATAGCGFSFDFWSISVCRIFVGVGEASFVSLASPYIDDNAPPSQRTAWLAIFYMCIPVGFAFGYVFGGVVGGHLNWRYAFWGESLLMLPFAVLGFVMKPLQLKGFTSSMPVEILQIETQDRQVNGDVDVGNLETNGTSRETSVSNKNQICKFWKDLMVLLHDKIYVINVLGYIAYNFVIGAYSYWGPKAGFAIYNMKNADMMFGGVTIICGIFGTLIGGYLLDRIHSTISNAFKLLSAATFLGAIFCFTAFCMKSLYAFLALFAIGELLVFATQAPVNYICLHCVKPSMRALSMAMSTVAIHIFGDVPSSPLVGVLQDHINNWRKTTLILTTVLFLASTFWCIGIFLPSVDRFDEDSDLVLSSNETSNRRPLLDERNEDASQGSK